MTNDELVARAAEKHKAMRDAIIKSGETGNDFEIAFAFAAFLAEMDHRSEERQVGGHIPCMKGIQDDG